MADTTSAIPSGWGRASLASLVTPRRTRVAPSASPKAPFIGMEHVESQSMRLVATVEAGIMKSAAAAFVAGDVLYGRLRPYLNKVVRPDFPGLCSAEFIVLPDTPRLRSAFLQYRLNAADFVSFASNLDEGDRPRVDFDQIGTFEVMLPPEREQLRIVAKIEELFSDLDAGVAALERVRANLKRYRAAVLKAAVEGRLTEEWRKQHPSAQPNAPRSVPPKSAGKKRAGRLWGAGFVPELTLEERDRVPSTWTWMKVKDLGPDPEDVVQVGPMSMKSSDFADSGVPVLNVGCVKWDWIDESKLDFMPETIASGFDRYRVRRGDVLFTRSGTVGRCAVASNEQDGWLMTFHLLRARPDPSVCQPRFLRMVFEGASHIRRQREKGSVGSTRAGFNTNLLASLDVPLPPLAEQAEIVAEVDRRLSVADAAEQQVEHALQRAARLRQAILKRAFDGKLVPQDPTDEPAAVLLDRLKASSNSRHAVIDTNAAPRRKATKRRSRARA